MAAFRKYSADNAAYAARPPLSFVFSHPAHAVALFFGAGCLRPGPGTWGTLAGTIVWIGFVHVFSWQLLAVLIGLAFAAGVWAAGKTSGDLGVEDAGCVVIDEVVAVWLVCFFFPQTPIAWLASFLAFRFFDIVKLPPAGFIDRNVHGGIGIMLDDFFAALWAAVLLVVIDAALNKFFPEAALFLGLF